MSEPKEKMVPLSEAEDQVKVAVRRVALLHLAYARTLVDEFGWEKGKQLVLNAIKEYGKRVAERNKRGFQDLPKYGWVIPREGKPPLCELAKVVLEYGEKDIGSLYCYIDAAKTMFTNPQEKIIHTKCVLVGDEYCEFARVPTTEKDRKDLFAEDTDWSHVDPRLAQYYKETREKLSPST